MVGFPEQSHFLPNEGWTGWKRFLTATAFKTCTNVKFQATLVKGSESVKGRQPQKVRYKTKVLWKPSEDIKIKPYYIKQ